MPRESVNPRIYSGLSSASDGESAGYVPMPTVEVGWTRDQGDVQIGLETPVRMVGGDGSSGQYHLLDHLYGGQLEAIGALLHDKIRATGRVITDEYGDQENPAHQIEFTDELLGRMVLDAVTGADGKGYPGPHGYTGWYTSVDRNGLNRLITLLRKAGAAAFGKDQW